MNRTTGRIAAAGLVILAFVVGQLLDADTAKVLNESPIMLKLLSIFAGVLAIATNYLPSIFNGSAATTTTTATTVTVDPPKPPV